jgi:hypothetical protein
MTATFAGAGLYGALVVKGDMNLDHNRVVDRLPATPRGRVRRWSVACRPALVPSRGFRRVAPYLPFALGNRIGCIRFSGARPRPNNLGGYNLPTIFKV